ncbi:hydroxyphenylacetyl-CoA thioesterase PaaI [Paracoccus albus]|uniref:hydroxyphenylacetyl-CoA thioesterase PaaI n=1 Tax=Paracoccus albus TaxID=3017784 RepID=UPI0022F1141D|nr:hydroxyphenylacetyl-CoA thioesterase PaaI [Paracoccus albus]WBU61909.1 hydroxyphenylacetyl-CoA thioesterase PaaI [Paracoccus albus]
MTPEEIARASADAMWSTDRASQHLGMKIEHIAPGQATLTMTVTEEMTNGHENAHGGYIFTLADSAFAFACNSYNAVTVGQQASINYVSPGKLGDVLTATATEASRTGRSGVYDVNVTNQDGRLVAHFRGLSRSIKGNYLPE